MTLKASKFRQDSILEHAHTHPSCQFIKSDEGKQLIAITRLSQHKASSNHTERAPIDSAHHAESDINESIIHYPSYASFHIRHQSFSDSNWPHANVSCQDPESMAKSGFFYKRCNPVMDTVFCFQCGNGLTLWKASERPDEEHYKHFPECPYIKERLHKIRQSINISPNPR